MEALKWSKGEIESEFSDCRNLSECIAEIERRLSEQNKVVCKIRVNNLLLQEQDEVKFAETELQDIDLLEIECQDSQLLLQDTLTSFVTWVDQATQAIVRLAEQYRLEGKFSDSYGFSKIIADTQWFIDALQVIRPHLPENSNWGDFEKKLASALKELEVAYRSRDVILVADILEYELTSCLDQWREWMLKAVQSRVR